jgi:hypothetical protein
VVSNIVSVECTADYVRMVAADGSEFYVTRAELVDGRPSPRAKFNALCKGALGDFIDIELMDVEYEPGNPDSPIIVTLRSS